MRFLKVDGDGDGFRLTKDFLENDIPRRYAVLSHTWGKDGDEVTFQDMKEGSGIVKPGFEKIRFCARRARCDGIKYFWVDTCCIDKNKQFELSKAITSMFRWYKRAEKCYVYLSDVPRDSKEPIGDTGDWEKDFGESRWFKRGWTLQELLAPASVEFFSRDGAKLGDKTSLEMQIRDTTNIPVDALRDNDLYVFTKQERFSWQEGRQTREEEDLVYSLIGIFDVSMPVIYGEGKDHARTRLDREIDIAQKGPDHKSFSVTFASPEVAATARFVARKSELREIHGVLRTNDARRGITIHGLGGMGKTQLAIEYAMQYKDEYSAVFWVNAKDEDSLKLSFGNIAKQIAREHPSADATHKAASSSERDEAVDTVKRWLSLANNTRWLIIYDNYDNPKIPGNTDPFALDLHKYVPESHQGCLIVTTRSSEVIFGQRMRIQKLETIDDSLAILSNQSDRNASKDDPDAIELVKKLDGLPLALATAGAYLRQTSITFAEYDNLYEASWAKLQKTSPYLDSYEDRQLYSTWQISFDQIQQRNEASAELLRLWAYFDNEDIWYELLCHDADEQSPAWLRELANDRLDFNSAIRVLCDHGIVDAHPPTRGQSSGYTMHSCVHSWTRDVLNAEPDEDLARTALFCVANSVPEPESAQWWMVQRRLFNHANRQLHEHASAGDDASWAFFNLGLLYRQQGKLAEAEKMYNRALQSHERHLGPEHTWTLITVYNLGVLYKKQGKLADAEKMYNRALQGFERDLGPDGDASTLQTVDNLGDLYREQGKLGEAEKMYNRALQGFERALGPDDTSTLGMVNTLGILYSEQGKLVEAEKMYNRALQGMERALGPDDTSTLATVHNLGVLYREQGKLVEAEKMHNRALQGCERALGPDHPSTLRTVHNLGVLYRYQDKLAEAEEMYNRALQGCERALGPDHPSTLDTVYNIGLLYTKQGRLSEAEQMHQWLVLAQENHSVALRDHFASFEEYLRAAGADITPLRRLQASDSSQGKESEAFNRSESDDARASDQSQLDRLQVSDSSQEEEDSEALDRSASDHARVSVQSQLDRPQVSDRRRFSVRRLFRRISRR